ncbi:MAG: GGDEF domain-containing protein [Thermoleophilia bacterium]
MIDDMELHSLQSMPTQEISATFPRFIDCMAKSVRELSSDLCVDTEFYDLAVSIVAIRKGDPAAARFFDDYLALKQLLIEAAASDLRSSDAGVMKVFQRLDDSFSIFLKMGLEASMDFHSEELQRMANTDVLTSLYNVRFFRKQISEKLQLFKRYALPFSLIMLDLDRLKQINDMAGHEAGDRILVMLAEIMNQEKREVDVAFRCGGDEFFIILPNTGIDQAESLARRISDRVRLADFESDGNRASVSCGIVSCPLHGTDVSSLRSKADKALYQAKSIGGGATVCYRESAR